MDYRSPLVDRRTLADATLCPACGADLARRSICGACGVDLSGEPGVRLWTLSRSAVEALDARVALLDDLTRAAPAGAVAAEPEVSTPWLAPADRVVPQEPARQQPARQQPAPQQAGRQQVAPVGVQRVLVTAGAFLLAVAVIGFLAFSWSVAGLGLRATIVAAVTSGVIGLAVFLRARLRSTAEAIASLSVVLLLCDVWAARETELPLADLPAPLLYVAITFTLVAAGLLAGAVATGLRAWAISGGALLVLGAGSFGAWVVEARELPEAWYLALPALAGAVACLAVQPRRRAAGRRVHPTAGRTARVFYALLVIPALGAAVGQGFSLLTFVPQWWEATPGTPLGDISDALWFGGSASLWSATATACLVAALTARLLASGLAPAPALRVLLGGGAAAAWFLAPASPVLLSMLLFALLAGLSALLAAGMAPSRPPLSRPALIVVGVAATAATLLLAWTVRPLSIPVTALVALGVLGARHVVAGRAPRRRTEAAVLASAAALLGLIAATVAPAWLGYPWDGPVPFWAIVTTAAVIFCTVGPYFANRSSVLATVLAVHLAWVLVEVNRADAASRAGGPQFGDTVAVALAAWLSAVVVIALAVRARAVVPGDAGRGLAGVSAFAVAPVLAFAAADSAYVWTDSGSSLAAVLVTGTVLVVALVLAGLVIRLGPARAGETRPACELGLLVTGGYGILRAGVDGALDGSGSGAAETLWFPLLLLGVAAAAIAVTPGRRWARWLSWLLLACSWWARLDQTDLPIEVYAVPPAAALLGLGLFDLVRRPRGTGPASSDGLEGAVTARALGPGMGLALLPSLWACTGGSPVRSVALMVTAVLLVLVGHVLMLGEWPSTVPGRRLATPVGRFLTAAGVTLSLATAVLRSATHPEELVEWYALGAVATLAIVVASGVDLWPGLSRAVSARTAALAGGSALSLTPRALAALLALVAAAAPTLLAAAAGEATVVRASITEGLTAVAVVGVAVLLLLRRIEDRMDQRSVRDGLWAGAGLATAICLVAAGVGASSPTYPVDVWTLPAGLALTALGATLFRRQPSLGSWRALGPGVALSLMPSLLIAVTSDGVFTGGPRALVLVVAATVAVVAGARLRLAAPFVLGVGALIWYGLYVLGPTLVALWRDAPVWLAVGLAGAVLLYVGATAERRLKDVAQARARLAEMR